MFKFAFFNVGTLTKTLWDWDFVFDSYLAPNILCLSRREVFPSQDATLSLKCSFFGAPKKVNLSTKRHPTVDGSEIRRENQLRLVVYPCIHRVLYIPGG